MELALQVVGLKMTGKIEDAKNVAMRIVGNAGSDNSEIQNGNSSNMQQLASGASIRDIRPLLLVHAGDNEDFETLIIDFLSILDTPLDHFTANSISTPDAISLRTASGQTLLHLAAFLGFAGLVGFLVRHGVDLDARDRNGYTALHFAALALEKVCARILVRAGADQEIVDGVGKTPQERAVDGFFEETLGVVPESEDEDQDEEGEDDEEARWGDAEEEPEDHIVVPRRVVSRRTPRRVEVSGKRLSQDDTGSAVSHIPPPPIGALDEKFVPRAVDEKQTASFIDMIQRTLAQLPAPQGIIPNMPQLPLPQLPGIGLPAVPWGVLPQIPMVFPVFVPTPGWPSFLGGEQHDENVNARATEGKGEGDEIKGMGAGAIRAAQEWRATWEKWMAVAIATATARQTEEMPPPMYTPREAESEPSQLSQPDTETRENGIQEEGMVSNAPVNPPSTSDVRPVTRRFGYGMVPVTDREVNAYAYQPTTKQTKKLQKR